jgi:hypothetical protein
MPRVSVYSTGSPDFLMDVVSDGMIRLLGRSSVHVRYNRTTAPHPKFDHLFRDFAKENAFGYHDADLMVCSIRCPIEEVLDWGRRTGKPYAVVDGEDDAVVRDRHRKGSKAYFKREYLEGRAYAPGVHPLPMGAILEDLPPADLPRTGGVFYQGRDNWPIREEVRSALHEMGFATGPDTMPKAEYNVALSRCRIGISARGVGWDTYRYWEIPYFGTLLLSQRLKLVIPDNFHEDREAVFWSSIDEMRAKLTGLLMEPGRLSELALAGREASRNRHLSIHRAKTVLERSGV